ncbi:proline dehydrogenase family protein [Echinicola sp. CAU 1574]|uniref:Proline dehydrogenase family protein n=1 Tax=Echinicola arenosa TaxID=2774144 RepID=A0ABR9ANK6_9BACT|nr:proline dehydrogenase family protein [Echinicola arenosa]MBD8490381.1 proline dehydrogenase family protein [Echinicola arenosa]
MNTKPNISFENTEIAFASRTDVELKKMYLIFAVMDSNLAVKLGTGLADVAFKLKLPIKGIMKKTMFGHFCGGESIEDCSKSIEELKQYGIGTILDYSVEGKGTEKSYDFTRDEILRTIERSAGATEIPFTVFKVTGLGSYKIMTKVQAGQKLSVKEQEAFERLKDRVDALCKSAYEHDVRIMIDGEESWFQDVIDDLAYEAMEKYNREKAIVYNTFQMYRKDMLGLLKSAHQEAESKGYHVGAKLVRGAYMEKERDRAEDMGYPSPIQDTKEDSDKDYNAALKFSIENKDRIYLVSGSHNELSNIILTELMNLHGLKPEDERVFFAQLYGMSDNISYNLAFAGYNVAKYVPYGPVESVMPYLYRRAAENTSVAGQSSREFDLIKNEIARRAAIKK